MILKLTWMHPEGNDQKNLYVSKSREVSSASPHFPYCLWLTHHVTGWFRFMQFSSVFSVKLSRHCLLLFKMPILIVKKPLVLWWRWICGRFVSTSVPPTAHMGYSQLVVIWDFNEILEGIETYLKKKGVQLCSLLSVNYFEKPAVLLQIWSGVLMSGLLNVSVCNRKSFCFGFMCVCYSLLSLFCFSFFKQKHLDTHLSMTSLKKGQSNSGFHLYASLSA